MRSATRVRVVFEVCAAAGLVLAGACSREEASGGAPPGPTVTGDPGRDIGGFEIRLEAATPTGPAHTAVQGGVYDGPFVSRTQWRKTGEAGGCALFLPQAFFCDPPCGAGVCLEGGVCQPEPSLRNAGTARIEGLRGEGGTAAPIEIEAIASQYQLPIGLTLAFPPFAPGAPVAVSVSGGEVGSFALAGKGISPLEVLTPAPVTVEAGKAVELRWTPPAASEETRVQVILDLSVHGGTKGKLDCDVPDSGSLTLPAGLLGQLVALGTAGFPSVVLARSSQTATALPAGRVKLSLRSEVTRPIVIPGQVSCESDQECPAGQVCQGNLLCGAR